MSINISTFYTCPGKSAKVPDNLTQCPGIGLKNYGMYANREIDYAGPCENVMAYDKVILFFEYSVFYLFSSNSK